MNILVKVTADRKCFASLDWNPDKALWIMSFGDLETPETDVEVEFSELQLWELESLLKKLERERIAKEASKRQHRGSC